ncbi:MAG: hypothetical protein Q4D21_05055 [Phascolarctobacterium sp.]|nr:hypothetical protein [Phascolarctobacterium sp.]
MKKISLLAALMVGMIVLPSVSDAAVLSSRNVWNTIKNEVTTRAKDKVVKQSQGGTKKMQISQFPQTLAEFKAMPQMDLRKPENTLLMFLCAANHWTIDKTAGEEAINLLSNPKRQMTPYDKQFLRDRLGDKHYLPRSYFEGATPANNYTPSEPLTLKVMPDGRPQDVEAGYKRLFVKTSGAEANRYIKLREKDGVWYLWEYFGLLPSIALPTAESDW